jgi:hypothetical protein
MKILVMAEYGSDGLWDLDDHAPLWGDELGISQILHKRLILWNTMFEKHVLRTIRSCTIKPFNWETFSEIGSNIAKSLKSEFPDWTVKYYDYNTETEIEIT